MSHSTSTPSHIGTSTLGIVLCDLDSYTGDYARCSGGRPGVGSFPRGFFENPLSWPDLDVTYAVAKGARVESIVHGRPAAVEGFLQAADRLSDCTLIISDCSFFYCARPDQRLRGNVITSSLDLLPTAAMMTDRPIGVLTASGPLLHTLLTGHPLADRLAIVGLDGEDGWRALLTDQLALEEGWTVNELKDGVRAALRRELAPAGRLADAGVLLLECTFLSQFRDQILELVDVPVVDVASFVMGALTGSAFPGDI